MNKKILMLCMLPVSLLILNCNTNIYPQYEKNPIASTQLIKFDLTMSYNTSKIWAPIKIFELSKQNMPVDDEGLKIKSCVSQWAGIFLEETIANDLMHLESEYKNTYKSTDPDLNKAILEYIITLIDFTSFVANKFKDSEYTIETPTYLWESEILMVNENDSKESVSGKLYFAVTKYGSIRNYNAGPTGSILRHYSDDINQTILFHHMKNLATKITGQISLKDSDNVDYYFYQANKEYLFNTDLCKN